MSFAHNRNTTNLKRKQESYKANLVPHRNNNKVADYYKKRLLNKISFWTNKDAKNNVNLALAAPNSNINISTSSSGNEYEDGDVEDNDIINDYEADFDQIKPKNNGHLDGQNDYFSNTPGQNNSPLTIESYIFKNNNNRTDNSVLNEDSELNLSQKVGNFNTLKLNKSFKDLLVRVSPFKNSTSNVYEDREDINEETDNNKKFVDFKNADFCQDLKAKEKVLTYVDEAIDDVWGRIYDSSTFAEEEIMTLYEQNMPTYISFDHDQMNKNQRRNHSSFSSTASANSKYLFENMENNTELNTLFSDGNPRRRSTMDSMNQNRTSFFHDAFAQKWKRLEVNLKDTKTKMESLMTSKNVEDMKLFWDLWDSIKTECIQLLEVDEDEESENLSESQYKSVIENLEHSRVYYN
ncbi:hypothetical protein D499_0AU00170 [Hanseniaspora uvarum DSM 2768]|nr:hypothetical protein D499_0AU00170 [Hanseniaspora uvarum DSM 2768]